MALAAKSLLERKDRSRRYVDDPVGFVTRELGEWLTSYQREILESVRDNRYTAVPSCHDSGKALALDTLLPTPTGWTSMGAVEVGDLLYDENGLPTRVIAATPIHVRPTYRITFDDGSQITASDNHLWTAIDLRHRPRNISDWRDQWGRAVTHDTATIAESSKENGQNRWRIPTARALHGTQAWDLPVDPYTLGIWLGDGTRVRAEITAHVDDVPHYIERTGGRVVSTRENASRVQFAERSYLDAPSRYLGGKRIPDAALRAPFTDRLDLLRGLMDTDGNGTDSAGVEFVNTNRELIEDARALVTTLGWKSSFRTKRAMLNGKDCGPVYTIQFRPDRNPFSLPRKAEAWAKMSVRASQSARRQRSRHTQRTIVSIEPAGDRYVRCVEVDSPRHLYLAGESMIPTHNSYLAARTAAWWLSTHPPGSAFVVTSAPTFHQVRAILWREIIRAHKKGKLVGRTNQTEWLIDDELVAFGRKPADYDDDAFQGIHARYVLVILDEACGIPASLWVGASTITTNEYSRILAIGNPDSPNSEFKRKVESNLWNVIHIDGYNTPNFTTELQDAVAAGELTEDEAQELSELFLSRVWVEERKEEWGEDSNLWQSKVRGIFPEVPVGQVYQELSQSMQWFGPVPHFKRLVGGLDFGGANDQAHKTAGVVAGLAHDESLDDQPIDRISPVGSRDVLVRTHHFEHSGPQVHDQLVQWMKDVESFYGRRVEWRADKSQMFGITLLKNQGFNVSLTHGGADSVWTGITAQRRRMEQGTSFYTEDLTRPPKFLSGKLAGTSMSGKSWYERMVNYRWAQQPDEDRAVPGVPIKRDDDTPDADRYLHEAADGFPSARGPAVARTTITGKPVTGEVD